VSIHAASWALDQPVFPSACKFLLFCIADNADENNLAVVDPNALAVRAGQTPEEVKVNIEELEKLGLITPSEIPEDMRDLYRAGYVGIQVLAPHEEATA